MKITFVGYGDFDRHAGMKQMYHFAQQVCHLGHMAQLLIAGSATTAEVMDEPPLAEIIELAFTGPLLHRSVRRRVTAFKPDIIHVWTPRHVPALAGCQLQKATGARLVLDHEDDERFLERMYTDTPGRHWQGPVGALVRPLSKVKRQTMPWLSPLRRDGSVQRMSQESIGVSLLRSRASAHTAISPALCRHVEATWPARTAHLLYPGVDLNFFHPKVSDKRTRQVHALGDDPVIAYIGTMNVEIVRYFVKVIDEVRVSYPKTRMLLIGDVSFVDKALGRALSSLEVICTGRLPYRRMPEYMSQADVLLQHPIDIGNELRLPAKLPEYLASGRPIVTYSTGIGEILKQGVHAIKLQTSDPSEMAAAVCLLLSDREMAACMGRAARALAESLFDWHASGQRLLEIYELVLGTDTALSGTFSCESDRNLA